MKTFEELFAELQAKAVSVEENSYTRELLAKGVHEIGKKIVEEAAEVWMAAEFQTKEELSVEISQLIYHLQVIMIAKDISPLDLERSY